MSVPPTELEEYFLFKIEQGLLKRGLANLPEYRTRLDYEAQVILSMGFCGYFLIVQDFVNWAKNNDIYISPGRGSAAGSLVSYVLGITSLDPIKWDLIFERFLNPQRISYPDVDFDCEKRYRDKVIEYLFQKYGEDHVAHIGTFNMMRAKAAVRAVTKTLGHPYQLGDKLSKLLLPPVHGKPQPLKESFLKVAELYELRSNNGTEEQILQWAEKVEGLISSVGVHASGIVISDQPLSQLVPLFRGKGDEIATQWEMGAIEEIGLIKFDILGLDALTKIHRCIDLIHERHGKQIDINNIPLDDEDTFTMLRAGEAMGVFQLEASSGMRDLLVQIRPTSIEDLVALVAIYRPGPLDSDYKQTYLNIRAGLEEPHYLVPELKPILSKTLGWCIYQDELIHTSIGKKPIRNITTQDFVLTENNSFASVSKVWSTGNKEVFKVSSDGNQTAFLTKDHRILTLTGMATVEEALTMSRPRKQRQTSQPLNINTNKAWLLGMFIGDGCCGGSSPTICAGDQEQTADQILAILLQEFSTSLPRKYFNTRAWYVGLKHQKGCNKSELNQWLRKTDLYGKVKNDKILPKEIFHWSDQSLGALLAGLFESDGHISNSSTNFTSNNPKLLLQIEHILDILKITYYRTTLRIFIRDTDLFYQHISSHLQFKQVPTKTSYTSNLLVSRSFARNLIDSYRLKSGLSIKKECLKRGLSNSYYFESSPCQFNKLILAFPEENLIEKTRGDFAFFNICKKESIGKQPVFDMEIDSKEHLFQVGKDEPVIIHNCIYQEQIIQIAKDLAGYSLAEADLLRKAISKKKSDEMYAHETKFKAGWKTKGLSEAAGNEIWDQIVVFANYAFNRSHAASYAFITYQTAWLKNHYPAEFMCAIMISESGNQEDIIKCITECKHSGIKVLPPDINNSTETFQISTNNTIHFGLAPVKNLGEKPVQLIIEERKKNGLFKSLEDFCQRVDLGIINKLKLESLILSGAFDQFNYNRATLLSLVHKIWEYREDYKSYLSKEKTFQKKLEAYQKREQAIQVAKDAGISASKRPASFKSPIIPEKPIWPEIIEVPELPEFEIQQKEHELLGFYVSSHPLDTIGNQAKNLCSIEDLKEMQQGTFISVAAVIVNMKEITTSKTKKKMAFLVLEDKNGTIEATAFPNTYEKYKELFMEGVPLKVDGKIEITETDDGKLIKLMINKLSLFNRVFTPEISQPQKITQTIKVNKLSEITPILKKFTGDFHNVELILELNDGTLIKVPSLKIQEEKNQFLKELSRALNE